VSFLIDTGADTTVLMPIDGLRMSIPYNTLPTPKTSKGVGGIANDFEKSAHIAVFDADGYILTYFVKLTISTPTPHNQDIPSLLGRDIINTWCFTADRPNNLVTAEPHSFLDKKKAVVGFLPSDPLVQ